MIVPLANEGWSPHRPPKSATIPRVRLTLTVMAAWKPSAASCPKVFTTGALTSMLPKEKPPSVLFAPRREHSRKPDETYELIERMYPGLRYLEIFARPTGERPGWTFWGNEVEPGGKGGVDARGRRTG